VPVARFTPQILLLFGLACRSAGPAVLPTPLACPPGHKALLRDGLYFGLVEPSGREISDAEWEAFLATVVTPVFPSGLTVLSARGQWQGNDGKVVREPSRLLVLFHPPDPAADENIRMLIQRYRKDFHQEAVLWERSLACTAF
jgi:hypothetical protein